MKKMIYFYMYSVVSSHRRAIVHKACLKDNIPSMTRVVRT